MLCNLLSAMPAAFVSLARQCSYVPNGWSKCSQTCGDGKRIRSMYVNQHFLHIHAPQVDWAVYIAYSQCPAWMPYPTAATVSAIMVLRHLRLTVKKLVCAFPTTSPSKMVKKGEILLKKKLDTHTHKRCIQASGRGGLLRTSLPHPHSTSLRAPDNQQAFICPDDRLCIPGQPMVWVLRVMWYWSAGPLPGLHLQHGRRCARAVCSSRAREATPNGAMHRIRVPKQV